MYTNIQTLYIIRFLVFNGF